MWEFRIDRERTTAAFEDGVFKDKRSHFNNRGHVFLKGTDKSALWELLYYHRRGLCAACGLWNPKGKLDMDHLGRTPKTRCDCYQQLLNDGTVCTGVRLLCTMDPRKGGTGKSCHARRHNREPKFMNREGL